MPMFYLETSALLKKYRTKSGIDVVRELFEGKSDAEAFITSYFTVLEVMSVARRLLATGTLNRRLYQRILGNFERDLREAVMLQSVSDSVIMEAVRQSATYVLRAPDAVHLATAVRANAVTSEPFYFVGSDAKLVAACENAGLAILNPEAPGALDLLRSHRSND